MPSAKECSKDQETVVWGLGFRVHGLGVWGLGFRGLGFRVVSKYADMRLDWVFMLVEP